MFSGLTDEELKELEERLFSGRVQCHESHTPFSDITREVRAMWREAFEELERRDQIPLSLRKGSVE